MKFNCCRIRDSANSLTNYDLSTLVYYMQSMHSFMVKHTSQTATSEQKEHATHRWGIIYGGVITFFTANTWRTSTRERTRIKQTRKLSAEFSTGFLIIALLWLMEVDSNIFEFNTKHEKFTNFLRLSELEYDAIIMGTGLTECIISGLLSVKGSLVSSLF